MNLQKEQNNNIHNIPTVQRKSAAEQKYREAVEMYATTALSIRQVSEICGVTAAGLSSHIGKHHRDLLFSRYGLDYSDELLRTIKVKPSRGQSLITHLKYKDAIEACGDITYIEFNVSQVARLFGLDGSALASQLKVHYPGVIENRERLRKRLGIADNTHRGPRQWCIETYAEALEMYTSTDLTITEVAEKCNVSKSGFCQFMRFYHKDIITLKASRRKAARKKSGSRKPGTLAGNGNLYGPKPETVELYGQALELYRTTSMTIDEIVEMTGVPSGGFKGYLYQWHRGEKLRRRGFEWDGISEVNLKETPHYLKSTAAKYEAAIASLRSNPRSVASVASEFGHNPEVFREYLKTHEPELAAAQGMIRLSNGKLVKRTAMGKYVNALEEYESTTESLKSIAQRHGIVYNSLVNFITRNCPEMRDKHERLVAEANNHNNQNKHTEDDNCGGF